ncbi:hypothetical protein NQ317_015185 [Molorchus minor]|uniref:Uncharacterized protein n=1 Tax=Molorchus minor TaxID=1323400 RepID=A0ABQ9K832_9CUCU|nr:hypothetical protein NQ317_015185 [Molorchus minor]
MIKIILPLISLVGTLASADSYSQSDAYGPPSSNQGTTSYKFEYGVNDPNTQDIKSQMEQRDGHQVTGSYMLKEADGTTRIVRYKSTPNAGFEATVERKGTAMHPSQYGQGYGYGKGSSGAPVYGPPGKGNEGSGGATSYVGVTKWKNQGDEGPKGYGH